MGLDAGNDLILSKNGSEDLRVQGNGAFSFATPVANGATYTVTVKAQPLWQNCAVTNGSGSATSPVSNVTVVCTAAQANVTTFAGSGANGSANGNGVNAQFSAPGSVTVDRLGVLYVQDGQQIRKITTAGDVTTLAGSATSGSANGNGVNATFTNPAGVAVDGNGNVYVADSNNNLIRKITPAGDVTTLAGSLASGATDGNGAAARFSAPFGVGVDGSGNVYVADTSNNLIRKITPAGDVTTLAGSGAQGADNGFGVLAKFTLPVGVGVDSVGNVYVADTTNHLIRKITPAGDVTTLAGSGQAGAANGNGLSAAFNYPAGVAVDRGGNVYVADSGNNLIRRITPAGDVTTLAGSGASGSVNGIGANSSFRQPEGVAVDSDGNVYVADQNNNLIRKISPVRTP
ncbi:NHL repeat-containing protein [Roseateles sp. UC29_93]|uniref:NHL repeat-containing protein n=1 Tax=Roseateles sp. UC29_93 TaxID=3350177 RepID=UPI00366CC5B5